MQDNRFCQITDLQASIWFFEEQVLFVSAAVFFSTVFSAIDKKMACDVVCTDLAFDPIPNFSLNYMCIWFLGITTGQPW